MIKKLIGIALLTFVISACRNVEDSLLETPVNPIQESRLIAYPKKSDLGNMTRSETVGLDWENWETVALASGVLVAPPWANNPVASDIPEEIRKDIKATDGWDLIVHTVNGYGEQGLNYGNIKGFLLFGTKWCTASEYGNLENTFRISSIFIGICF